MQIIDDNFLQDRSSNGCGGRVVSSLMWHLTPRTTCAGSHRRDNWGSPGRSWDLTWFDTWDSWIHLGYVGFSIFSWDWHSGSPSNLRIAFHHQHPASIMTAMCMYLYIHVWLIIDVYIYTYMWYIDIAVYWIWSGSSLPGASCMWTQWTSKHLHTGACAPTTSSTAPLVAAASAHLIWNPADKQAKCG